MRRFLEITRRLSLLSALLCAFVCTSALELPSAMADDWDDDEDEDEGAGDEDDEYEEDEEESDGEEGYEQPPATAGGLFTKATWPRSYIQRNLMVIGGMLELRGGLDVDMSDRTAFEIWRTLLSARYGIGDTLELHAGGNFVAAGEVTAATASGAFNFLMFFGLESAIVFELVDFRLTGELRYIDIEGDNLDFDIAFGFPFRYRFNKKVAVYALERLMTIQTGGTKPDFTLGFSVAFQALEQLAVIGGARVNVADFNFKDNAVSIPAQLGILFAPKNTIDLGLQFSFLNLKPPGGDEKFYDQRSLLLYAQLRL